jgi:hypothetical protein
MPPVGFEPTILASARPQTFALDRTAAGIGLVASSGVISVYTMLDLFMVGSFCPLFYVFRLHSLGSSFLITLISAESTLWSNA